MEEFKINAQSYIIDDILSHIKNGHMGMAFANDWNYVRKGNTLYFTLKENGKVDLSVIFWFGYLTNQ